MRAEKIAATSIALALLATATDSRAVAFIQEFQPPEPNGQTEGQPLGSAATPEEDSAEAAPAAPQKYPPRADWQRPDRVGEERAEPNYASREPDLFDYLLWGPRAMLFPLYLVTEYGIRWPLNQGLGYAELHYWPEHIVDFLTFGPHNEAIVYPVFYVDLGYRPKAGLFFSWSRALVDANSLRARVDTSGLDSFVVRGNDNLRIGRHVLAFSAGFLKQPDHAFRELGPLSPRTTYRYGAQITHFRFETHLKGWRTSEVLFGAEFLDASFDPSKGALGGESVSRAVAQGDLPALPAGMEGYAAFAPKVQAALDSRLPRKQTPWQPHSDFVSPPGTGFRLATHGKYAINLRALDRSPETSLAWVNYGGLVGAYVDLNGRQRTLGLEASADLVDSVAGGPEVPFLELPALGGTEPMPGLRRRRLVDDSAVAARLEYRWPIWVSLDGTADAALGNVFGKHFEGFDPKLLRASFALGVRTISARDHAFEILIGAGTTPLRDGAKIEEIRFAAGTYTSF